MTTNLTALYGLSGGGSGKWKSQVFTTSGVWVKPEGVETIKVLLVGAGGNENSSGQNSQFNSTPFSFIAKGGGKGGYAQTVLNSATVAYYRGGSGGGAENYMPPQNPLSYATTPYPLFTGNGGIYVQATGYGTGWYGGLPGIASGDSISGGGGGSGDDNTGGSGGSVIGFGSGGAGSSGGGGGGGSFGNGGAGGSGSDGVFGGGGGGNKVSGGGGGEIIIREIAITSPSASIIIGQGAAPATFPPGPKSTTNRSAGAGGNGLCIVYWIE